MWLPLDDVIDLEKKVPLLCSSSIAVNVRLKGGLRAKRTHMVIGKPHHGKSHLLADFVACGLRANPEQKAYLVDTEMATTTEFYTQILTAEERKRLFVVQTAIPEEAFSIILDVFNDGVKNGETPIVGLDSLAMLAGLEDAGKQSTDDDEGDSKKKKKKTPSFQKEKMNFRFQKMSGEFLRSLVRTKYTGWFLIANQTRTAIPTPGKILTRDFIIPGGEVWEYIASTILRVVKVKPKYETNMYGMKIQAIKSKSSKLFTHFLDIDQQLRIDPWSGAQQLLLDYGVLKSPTEGYYVLGDSEKKLRWNQLLPLLEKNREKILKILQQQIAQ